MTKFVKPPTGKQVLGAAPPDPWPPNPSTSGFGENIPISKLPLGLPPAGPEWVPIVQDGVTVKVPVLNIAELAASGSVPPATAANQTIVSGAGPDFPWAPQPFTALPVVSSWNGQQGNVVMQASDVTAALTFTPYNATNPAGYQTAAQVAAAVPVGSSTTPVMDGTAAIGVGATWARADHVHPSDTSRLPLAGGTLTGPLILNADPATALGSATKQYVDARGGVPEAPNNGQLYGRQSLAWVVVPTGGGGGIPDAPSDGTPYGRQNAAWINIVSSVAGRNGAVVLTHTDITDWATSIPIASSTTPVMDGAATIGVGTTWARADHVHPSDTSRYAASNPSGYQTAAQVAAAVPGPATTTPIQDGTGAVGTGTTWARADHVHPSDTAKLSLTGGTMTGVLGLPAAIFPLPTTNTANGATTVNRANGEVQKVSITANATITISGWPATGNFGKIVLDVSNTGAFTLAWSGVLWAGGSAPTMTSGSGGRDVYCLFTDDGGTTVLGTVIGQNFH